MCNYVTSGCYLGNVQQQQKIGKMKLNIKTNSVWLISAELCKRHWIDNKGK